MAAGEINTREDFAAFLAELCADLRDHPDRWENTELAAFLAAMHAWTQDMDGYYLNTGNKPPAGPTWQVFADILKGASVYE